MTEEGEKKTIKNVLSVPQLTSIGCSAIMEGNKNFKFTIKDPNRKLFTTIP